MPTRSVPLSLCLILLVFGGWFLTGCCPPNCATTPVNLQRPEGWDELLDAGRYGEVIEATRAIIGQGDQHEFYAEARLYRGLAELRRNGDLNTAQTDLTYAEQHVDQLKTVDAKKERFLLYGGQMLLSAQQEDSDAFEKYLKQVTRLAPDQPASAIEYLRDALPGKFKSRFNESLP